MPNKCPVDYAVKAECEDLQRFGCGEFIYKSDQEPALLALKNAVAADLGPSFKITMELSPVHEATGDSEANGHVERAIQEVGGQVR